MAIEDDPSDIERQVAVASPALAAGRALATAIAVSRTHARRRDGARHRRRAAPGRARRRVPAGARGAPPPRRARRTSPPSPTPSNAARATLAEPAVLADVCRRLGHDADAAIAGEILHAAGPAGAEALLDSYVRMGDPAPLAAAPGAARHERARPRRRSAAAAHRRARDGDRDRATCCRRSATGGRCRSSRGARPASTSRCASRRSRALADDAAPEAADRARQGARTTASPRRSASPCARSGASKAAPRSTQLTRALEDLNVFAAHVRDTKEIIRALEQIGTPEAETRTAADRRPHTFGLGRKSRELRTQARRRR